MRTHSPFTTLACLLSLALSAPAQEHLSEEAQMLKALDSYDFDTIEEAIAAHEAAVRKPESKGKKKNQPKPTLPDWIAPVRQQMSKARSMLDRVEQLDVLEAVNVPANDLHSAQKLSASSGRVGDASLLPAGLPTDGSTTTYVSEDADLLVWSGPGQDGERRQLFEARRLADGSYTAPVAIMPDWDAEDVNYPFMLPDGITLYFAAKTPEGLGGYDLYMTRRDGASFLLPQNMGMPYNSRTDDFGLVIDEETGIGSWASKRRHSSQLTDSVTIFTYKLSDLRRNYPDDTPDLAAKALLSQVPATTSTALSSSAETIKHPDRRKEEFALSVPGSGIYTSLAQFRNPQARELMQELLVKQRQAAQLRAKLDRLRAAYRNGSRAVSDSILSLEQQVEEVDAELSRLRNAVIANETGR